MKKIIATICTTLMLTVCTTAVFADDSITVKVNNQEVTSEQTPVNIDGSIFVPLRPVSEAMGYEVVWSSKLQTATISSQTDMVTFKINTTKATKNEIQNPDRKIIIDCGNAYPRIINGGTYIPLRVMAEAFDATVGWDASTRTVMIIVSDGVEYEGDKTINVYAGNGIRKRVDGINSEMGFLSPESMDIMSDGTLVVSDSGTIRKITASNSESVEFEPNYIVPDIVRTHNNDIYFTTKAFENEDNEKYYGIVKLTNGGAEGVYLTEAVYSKMEDFDIDSNGNIYALIYNAGSDKTYIGKIADNDINYLAEIDDGIKCMAIADDGNIYLGNTVKGSIYTYNVSTNETTLFAGVDNKTSFVDGANPKFFEPRAMFYENDNLYVIDYNLIRKITLSNGQLVNCKTIAGKISTELKPKTENGKASNAEIAPSYLADIVVSGGKVYITDPVNAVLRVIE